jgi:predicted alpha/beta superfamily hydrolase
MRHRTNFSACAIALLFGQFILSLQACATAVTLGTSTSTVVGTLQIVQVPASVHHAARTIRVWLPAGYDANPHEHYTVLYMQDGQNCFDHATSAFGKEWQIDESLTRMIADGRVPPMIVVGIDNAGVDRISEYTFVSDPKYGGGKGAAYADLLLNHIKPFVEKSYRVRTDHNSTFIGGSSIGALVSLEIARRHPGIFAGVIAMSPSLWWDDQATVKEIESAPAGLLGARIWIDIGTHEDPTAPDADNQKTVDEARRLDEVLTAHGIAHRFMIDQNARHDEIAWAKRFPAAILYLTMQK